MKRIDLQRLELRNFKGMNKVFAPDGQDTDVFGANASGKTTLADAAAWLLFGKDTLGRAEFEIKNLNAMGETEHGLDHSVEGSWLIAGIPITLKKVYHETWTKKRASTQKTLTGNTTDHYIDDVPVKENEYKAKIAEIAGDESVFRLLTSPTVFPSLPWQKQRSLLLDACGDVTDAQVIATDESLAPLTELLKKYSVSKTPIDDLKKVVKSGQTSINDKIKAIPIRIDEATRGLPDITGLDRDELYENIVQLDHQIDNAKLRLQGIDNGAGIAELSKQLQDLNFEIGQLQNKYYLEGMQHVTKLTAQINELTSARDAEQRAIQGIKDEIVEKQGRITSLETRLEKLRGEWASTDGERFEDATEDTCPTCGQALPTDRVEEARTKALAAFNKDKAERLFEIETKGKALRSELDKTKEQIEDLHAKIQSIPTFEPVDLDGFIAERDALKAKAEDYTLIPGRAELLERKTALEKQIEEARAGVSQDKDAVQAEIDTLETSLRETKEKADRFTRREQGEKRIEELKAEEKKLAAEYEELERQLFLIESFTKRKVSMLNEKINARFKVVRFKLFNEQLNGGIDDCCEITVNGVPYGGGLNSAARTQAGCEIISVLQEHYGIAPVLWLDNRESCTEIPEMNCQLISLYVSPEDRILRIERAQKREAA